ncbi:hypothetical protein FVE85_8778 [Porphyridium purpureum]|uniref:Uncharacterized protein n=1 Tax=Porphyridium purpureum TaxID=35688 RepID=A0A5J4YRC0_PORPP|nr:hypothetical protein FVE85_8778 [Porphyridium purpureum]|eukprot:POR2763..scf296_7
MEEGELPYIEGDAQPSCAAARDAAMAEARRLVAVEILRASSGGTTSTNRATDEAPHVRAAALARGRDRTTAKAGAHRDGDHDGPAGSVARHVLRYQVQRTRKMNLELIKAHALPHWKATKHMLEAARRRAQHEVQELSSAIEKVNARRKQRQSAAARELRELAAAMELQEARNLDLQRKLKELAQADTKE